MEQKTKRILLVSDFTLDNLAGLLNQKTGALPHHAITGPFGQVFPLLLDAAHEVWQSHPDVLVVWTRPESVIPGFGETQGYKFVEHEKIALEVDRFVDALKNAAGRVQLLLVADWSVPPFDRGTGMLDLRPGQGVRDTLRRMNLRLAEQIAKLPNAYLIDSQRWLMNAGIRPVDSKLWYMGKIAFSSEVFSEAAADIRAAIDGSMGLARKLIIVDLDDTLWGGIVGDDGWENLRLGGHDLLGEAYVDFQRSLQAMTNRGILLGIVSKNEETIALEAIRKHPDMVLKLDDFAGWRINWDDKARYVVALVEELNLGLQSVVFIDDNPVERARVREALPEVLVPDWPDDKLRFAETLLSLRCFDSPVISAEDKERARMYVTERKRKDTQADMGSLADWLTSLEIRVTIEALNDANLQRTTQLLNKTNQMNLATRRLAETELKAWVQQPGHHLWTFRVADKFGDSGLTGILSIAIDTKQARIVDFVLSCRVMGRKVEETMLAHACKFAVAQGGKSILAEYLPTPKNKPVLDFWMKSGFSRDGDSGRFSWDLAAPYPFPVEVRVEAHE